MYGQIGIRKIAHIHTVTLEAIGIDEENNYCLNDVSGDPNRKDTQKIVDFLKDKKFAGGIRPVVFVESLNIHGSVLDVIIIKNSFFISFVFKTDKDNY